MDIIYIVITLHKFIVIHSLQDEKDIYNRKDFNDEKSEDVNRNQNKAETSIL